MWQRPQAARPRRGYSFPGLTRSSSSSSVCTSSSECDALFGLILWLNQWVFHTVGSLKVGFSKNVGKVWVFSSWIGSLLAIHYWRLSWTSLWLKLVPLKTKFTPAQDADFLLVVDATVTCGFGAPLTWALCHAKLPELAPLSVLRRFWNWILLSFPGSWPVKSELRDPLWVCWTSCLEYLSGVNRALCSEENAIGDIAGFAFKYLICKRRNTESCFVC